MKRFKGPQSIIQGLAALALSLALPIGSWANITNTASATYNDLAGSPQTPVSSAQVVIVTPPLVTAPTNQTLDVGVAMTALQVTATNAPTTYALSGQPVGINISNTGLITGTPGAGSAGSYTVIVTANNIAGSGTATFTILVRGPATIVLTKTANVTKAVSGDIVTYTIAYQNTGAGAATNVIITDAIPAGSTYKAGSITGGGTFAAGTITWTISTVNPGAPVNLTFQVTVN